jgi:hypothetical protein
VQRNLTSALILEDDSDWDVRIKDQLHDFALSTRTLIQPLESPSHDQFADPTFLNPSGDTGSAPEIYFDNLPRTEPPSISPYGDDWDVLWLGHCGMLFPWPGNPLLPKGRVLHLNDDTVPQKQYLFSVTPPLTLADDYPQHTRAVNHVQDGVCTSGYAVSQRGAQKLLLEVGLMDVERPVDVLLALFCTQANGRETDKVCLGVQPGLFQHHRPAGPGGAASDIDTSDGAKAAKEHASTDMLRWSTIMNAHVLLDGGHEFWDQLPDDPKVEMEDEQSS